MIATKKQLTELSELVCLPRKDISSNAKLGILKFIHKNANTIGGACELCDDLSTQQLKKMVAVFQHEIDCREGKAS